MLNRHVELFIYLLSALLCCLGEETSTTTTNNVGDRTSSSTINTDDICNKYPHLYMCQSEISADLSTKIPKNEDDDLLKKTVDNSTHKNSSSFAVNNAEEMDDLTLRSLLLSTKHPYTSSTAGDDNLADGKMLPPYYLKTKMERTGDLPPEVSEAEELHMRRIELLQELERLNAAQQPQVQPTLPPLEEAQQGANTMPTYSGDDDFRHRGCQHSQSSSGGYYLSQPAIGGLSPIRPASVTALQRYPYYPTSSAYYPGYYSAYPSTNYGYGNGNYGYYPTNYGSTAYNRNSYAPTNYYTSGAYSPLQQSALGNLFGFDTGFNFGLPQLGVGVSSGIGVNVGK